MVNLTIDGKQISVKENTTIMEAARQNGIPIPKLCYLKGINEIAACRVCVVELEGKNRLITSCNNVAEEGMVIHTNSPKVRKDRRTNVELILSQHDCQCVTCARSGNCSLQKIANDLNILDIPFEKEIERQLWNQDFPLIRDSAKCIKCMRCIQVCDKVQKLSVWDVEGTGSRTTVNVAGHGKIEDAPCSCADNVLRTVRWARFVKEMIQRKYGMPLPMRRKPLWFRWLRLSEHPGASRSV